MLVLFCISSFEGTSYKKLHDAVRLSVDFKERVKN